MSRSLFIGGRRYKVKYLLYPAGSCFKIHCRVEPGLAHVCQTDTGAVLRQFYNDVYVRLVQNDGISLFQGSPEGYHCLRVSM